jgi:hypothetical protein
LTHPYVDAFLKLKCAPDILAVTSPIARATKEISEVYAVTRALKKIIHPATSHFYSVGDLCAGNGLLGVTIAHLFNYISVTCLDLKVPNRRWANVRKFSYFSLDINRLQEQDVGGKVLVANHPCKNAAAIVDKFCKCNAKALVLMPCCNGQLKPRPQMMLKKLGKYNAWCADLYDTIIAYRAMTGETIEVKMYEDTHCLSPRNVIITAIRK